ncbi:hypothetical protein C8R43DRAFT_847573, partial [Mycena crocata]
TGCIISGSAVTSLVNAGQVFEPGDIDFYVRLSGGYDVVRYITKSGKYSGVQVTTAYDFVAGIGKVWALKLRGTELKINVIESLTDNPFDAVCHFHSTCVFGAWTLDGVWHGYPSLNLRGISITTHTQFPLNDSLSTHQAAWRVLRKYTDRGFTFSLGQYDAQHECGVDRNCPATIRTTDDAGCLYIAF